MDDTEIKKNVIEILKLEPGVDSQNIIVSVENGLIKLNGSVHNYKEKHRVEKAARNISGFNVFVEDLIVDLDPSLQRSDADIMNAIINTLALDFSLIASQSIKVSVKNGHVELSGEVEHYHQKEQVKNCVMFLSGIKSIVNNIKVKASD